MKKTLAIVLSLLVAFSMFTVMVSAANEPTEEEKKTLVEITFVYQIEDKEEVIDRTWVAPGTPIASDAYVPDVPDSFKRTVKDENGNEKEYKYTFKGWRLVAADGKGDLYYDSTLPTPTAEYAGKVIVFNAEYSVEDYSERQSFWNLVESIFERINKIFEYFATIFKW